MIPGQKRLNDVQYESRRALSQVLPRLDSKPSRGPPGRRSLQCRCPHPAPSLLFMAGLVDECQLFLAPVAVGGGIRALPDNIRLQPELVGERRFRSGVAFLHYRSSTADA